MNNPLIEWLDKSDWNNFDVPSRDAARFNRMLRNEFETFAKYLSSPFR